MRAAHALARIRGGADFASVASALSDEAHAKQTGGDLGLVPSPRDKAPSLPEVVLSRLKIGETSDIEETPIGFAIFQRSADPPSDAGVGFSRRARFVLTRA